MAEIEAKDDSGARLVRLEWGTPSTMPMIAADEVFIQDLGDRVFLTFGQLHLPLSTTLVPEEIQVVPVARLVLTRDAMQKFRALIADRANDQPESPNK